MVQNLVTVVRQSEMDGRPGQGGLLDNRADVRKFSRDRLQKLFSRRLVIEEVCNLDFRARHGRRIGEPLLHAPD